MISLNSSTRSYGLAQHNAKKRELKKGVELRNGEWAGWRARGPYRKGWKSKVRFYYTLVKEGEVPVNIDVDKIDIPLMAENTKPFIDWIKW